METLLHVFFYKRYTPYFFRVFKMGFLRFVLYPHCNAEWIAALKPNMHKRIVAKSRKNIKRKKEQF